MILRFDQWSGKSGLLVGAGITTVIVLSLAEPLSLLPITLITHLAKEILFLSNRSSNHGHHAELWPFVSALSHEFSSPLCPRPPPLLRRQSCPLPSFSEQRTPGKRSHGHHRQVSGRQTSPPLDHHANLTVINLFLNNSNGELPCVERTEQGQYRLPMDGLWQHGNSFFWTLTQVFAQVPCI